jgi:acetate kinase
MAERILTLNAGSSSIKVALFAAAPATTPLVRGQIEGIGAAPRLILRAPDGAGLEERSLAAASVPDHAAALDVLLESLAGHRGDGHVGAVGHRVVHGGAAFVAPVEVDDAAFEALRALEPLAPLHQPHNLAGIAAARRAFPAALQVACFDTAFHRTQPWVSDTYALPRAYYDRGIRRYGFHGLSYESVMARLTLDAPGLARGRVVLAHLGNGASLCAVRGGRAQATTMGFSPLDGLPMGTRSGQIDPGVLLYLMTEDKLDAAGLADLLNRRSGLLGLSGLSNDVRTLDDAGTADAVGALDYFVARAVREIGGLAAVLGGLEGLVFSGGIGENAWHIRARIVEALGFLGLDLDVAANRRSDPVISTANSRVAARIVPADEEAAIARHTAAFVRGERS